MDRAFASEAKGHWFESSRAHHTLLHSSSLKFVHLLAIIGILKGDENIPVFYTPHCERHCSIGLADGVVERQNLKLFYILEP